jgi:hypothetical protein
VDQKDQPTMPKFTVGDEKRAFSNIFNLLVIIAAVIATVFTIALFFYQLSLKNQISDLTGQKASLLSQIQTPENLDIEDQVNGIITSIDQIKSIKDSDSNRFQLALSNLPAIALKISQVKNFSIDEFGILSLDVTTNSNENVAKFLESLNKSSFLENVQLLSSNASGTTEAPVIDFSVTATINQDKTASAESSSPESAAGSSTDSTSSDTGTDETTTDSSQSATEPPEASL